MSVYSRDYRTLARRFLVCLMIIIGLLLLCGLYFIKTQAQSARLDVVKIEREIEQGRDRIQILQAEIAHLQNPTRLEALSQTHLGYMPIEADRAINPDDIEVYFPLRGPESKLESKLEAKPEFGSERGAEGQAQGLNYGPAGGEP